MSVGTAGGHVGVRRLWRVMVSLLLVVLCWAPSLRAGGTGQVAVSEKDGAYYVTASFDVPQSLAVATAVLTDYERMPVFMPKIQSSVIRERQPGHVVVEQHIQAKWFLFSRKIHLCLEVIETPGAIHFKDTSGDSFSRYEGHWALSTRGERTIVGYTLTAKPTFTVPGFMLSRLMKSDADDMIAGLRTEMAKRGTR